MSLLFVLVGQCGTQVGGELCRRLPVTERTHHTDGCVRCVGVDTEPKVIADLLAQDSAGRRPTGPPAPSSSSAPPPARRNLFRRSSFVWEESGRGNNWAFGYTGSAAATRQEGASPSPERRAFTTKWQPQRVPIVDRALAALDEEVRRAGFVEGMLFFHSLAGGTGSGLGSRLLEECRKRYGGDRVMHFVSVVVAPHRFGDTAVGSLNSLLTVSHLLQYSDLALWVSNQHISDCLTAGPAKERKAVSLTDINRHIVTALLLLLQGGRAPFAVSQLVATAAPHPCHKIADVALRAAAAEGWGDALRASLLPFRRTPVVGCVVSVSSWGAEDSKQATRALEQAVADRGGFPNVMSLKTHVVESPSAQPGVRHIATAATVPAVVLKSLVYIGNHAGAKVHVGAYLHWYADHGVVDEHFRHALDQLREVVTANQEYLDSKRIRRGRF